MKAELKKDCYIWITAETPAEALAIKYLTGDVCQACNQLHFPIVVDGSILNEIQISVPEND